MDNDWLGEAAHARVSGAHMRTVHFPHPLTKAERQQVSAVRKAYG